MKKILIPVLINCLLAVAPPIIAMNASEGNSAALITISQEELAINFKDQQKIIQAFRDGVFYVEIPKKYKPLVSHAVDFANQFHKDDNIKNLQFKGENPKLEGFSGYHNREQAQAESFYLEEKYWKSHFSPKLQKLARHMRLLSIKVLRKALSIAKIPKNLWEQGSGGVTENKGMHHLAFNHYRHGKQNIGMNTHRDFDYAGVLFINREGLQAKVGDKWQKISPKKGYFVLVLGTALETLINNPDIVTAPWHRVEQLKEERVSIALFSDNNYASKVYRVVDGSLEVAHENYKDCLIKAFEETYAAGKLR